jgi:hypothetical protein
MKEPNSEGLANCTGPESCGGTARKDGTEALTGVRAGWVLSREIDAPRREPWVLRGADAVEDGGRQHRGCRYREAGLDPARSPKARAGCGNVACPDPWRGLWVTINSYSDWAKVAPC